MNMLGFTGTRKTIGYERHLYDYLERAETQLFLQGFDGYVTGGCIGWDALVGRYLAMKFPDATHVVVVPADRSRVDAWWEEFDPGFILVIEMPDDTDYRARNEEIVRRSSYLFYCAEHAEDDGRSKRSGTWMTYRIAQAAGIPCAGIVLGDRQTVLYETQQNEKAAQ